MPRTAPVSFDCARRNDLLDLRFRQEVAVASTTPGERHGNLAAEITRAGGVDEFVSSAAVENVKGIGTVLGGHLRNLYGISTVGELAAHGDDFARHELPRFQTTRFQNLQLRLSRCGI